MEFVLEPCLNGGCHYVGRVSSYVNWFISYNPMTFDGHTETAIVFHKGYHKGKKHADFAILEGDFREQYRNCKTLAEALQVYIDNYDKVNFFSDVSVEFAKEVIKEESVK